MHRNRRKRNGCCDTLEELCGKTDLAAGNLHLFDDYLLASFGRGLHGIGGLAGILWGAIINGSGEVVHVLEERAEVAVAKPHLVGDLRVFDKNLRDDHRVREEGGRLHLHQHTAQFKGIVGVEALGIAHNKADHLKPCPEKRKVDLLDGNLRAKHLRAVDVKCLVDNRGKLRKQNLHDEE